MYEYHSEVKKLIDKVVDKNQDILNKVIDLVGKTIIDDKIIHAFGTGHSHMIGLELFARAGGIANVNAMLDSTVMTSEGARRSAEIERISGFAKVIWDQHKIKKNDIFIVISNSGRNAMPIEMAELAKNNSNKVIAITSIDQSIKYPARIKNQRKLYQIADYVIDNCVPSGDSIIPIGKDHSGAVSSILGCFIVNLIVTESLKIVHKEGKKLPLFYSQNIDGISNEELFSKFEKRVKHL
tara:strand:+ start:1763 stop:2479 length:717 start_codon:yes stop_codon:yes gene_type:complete